MIYLDYNATTPIDPEVYDAVFSSLRRDFGNPSSSHLFGRKAREAVEQSRESVADLIGCGPTEIFFTSGGTESNNLAILGTAMAHRKGHVITSSIEHPSVMNPCRHLESLGFDVTYADVDENGMVIPGMIKDSIRDDTVLISIMHSNNETGVIQPIEEVGMMAKEKRITFHVDAAQSIGKMPLGSSVSFVDLLTVVSHKFYGPKGTGALFVRTGVALKPILFGAGHENGLRPGTENVAGIVGLGKACQIAMRDIKLRVSHTTRLREMLWSGLKSAIQDVRLNGHETKRLPNTLNVHIPGIASNDLVEMIRDDVAISTGSACHAGKPTPSTVLKKMGFSDEEALSSVRLSTGKDNTEEEINEAVGIIAGAVAKLREKSGTA
jgi:cysteine desulfurase